MKKFMLGVVAGLLMLFGAAKAETTVTLTSDAGDKASCVYDVFAMVNGNYKFHCIPPPNPTTCPNPPSNVVMIPGVVEHQPIVATLGAGQIASYKIDPFKSSGYVQVLQNTQTNPSSTWEIWWSRCPGDRADPIRNQVSDPNQFGTTKKPCVVYASYTSGTIYWSRTTSNINTCKVEYPQVYVNYIFTNKSGYVTTQLNYTGQ